MSEEKKKRVFSAVLSGAVMLISILFAVLIYQTSAIIVRKNEIKACNAEISKLYEEIEGVTDEISSWELEWKIEERARELGLHYEKE